VSIPPSQALEKLKTTIHGDAQIVYLAVGGNRADVESAKHLLPHGSIICYEEAGIAGVSIRPFAIRTTPYLLVLNEQTKLSAYGPLSELNNLVSSQAK
jgi:hypothetical protein